jgi:hypothetical protein
MLVLHEPRVKHPHVHSVLGRRARGALLFAKGSRHSRHRLAELIVGRLVADGSIDSATRQLGEIAGAIRHLLHDHCRRPPAALVLEISLQLCIARRHQHARVSLNREERRALNAATAAICPLFWLFRDPPLTRPDPPRACALFICIFGRFYLSSLRNSYTTWYTTRPSRHYTTKE